MLRVRVEAEQAGLLPYKGELVKGLEDTQARSKEMKESRKQVIDLLRRYNEFVSSPKQAVGLGSNGQTTTVSDLFLELHHRIEAMENVVAKKESRKRRELASQY
jgi:hypothetical protein